MFVFWRVALNPPYLWCFVFLFSCFFFFPFFASIRKNLFVALEKGIFCSFLSVSLCFSLAFLASPFFNFSFSVSLLFFSSCFFLLSFDSLFFSLSFLFFLLCFCFMKGTTSKTFNCNFFGSIFSLFFGFLSSSSSFESLFSYLCFFLISIHVFCSLSMFLVSKNPS